MTLVTPHEATVILADQVRAGDWLPVADPWARGMHWRRVVSLTWLPDDTVNITCDAGRRDETITTQAARSAQLVIRSRYLPPPS